MWKNLINVFSVNKHPAVLIPYDTWTNALHSGVYQYVNGFYLSKDHLGIGAQRLWSSKQMNKNRIYLSHKISFYMHVAFCVNNFSCIKCQRPTLEKNNNLHSFLSFKKKLEYGGWGVGGSSPSKKMFVA